MKKLFFAALAVGLAAVLVVTGFSQFQRIAQLEATVNEFYRSALRQSAEALDELALHMEKAMLTTDAARASALLHRIGVGASSVQQSLGMLPTGQSALASAQVFVNRLADEAAVLLPRIVDGSSWGDEDRAWLRQQVVICSQLASQLALADSYTDLDSLRLDIAVPVEFQEAKGLPQGTITQEEALSIARSFVGESRVRSVQAAPGTSGTLAAYGVTVQTEDVQLNVEVTRQGGQVLWMMPETASFTVVQGPEACRQAAEEQLALHGFPPMDAVYTQTYDGLCVISFVPLLENVLLYPDLIRVQVRMDTAQVVGLEAHSYWLNHVQRQLPAPALTAEQAAAPLASHTEIEAIRLCIIPQDGAELLCYECSVSFQEESYLVYMDAQTGREVESLKKISNESDTWAV